MTTEETRVLDMILDIAKRGNAGPNIACALAHHIEHLREQNKRLNEELELALRKGDP